MAGKLEGIWALILLKLREKMEVLIDIHSITYATNCDGITQIHILIANSGP